MQKVDIVRSDYLTIISCTLHSLRILRVYTYIDYLLKIKLLNYTIKQFYYTQI